MIARVLSAALVAGFLAACVVSLLQAALTTPLILQAEAIEREGARPRADIPGLVVLVHGGEAHAHDAAPSNPEWQPTEGLSRFALTGLATLVSAVGYALVLLALMLASGAEPRPSQALAWAAGGFAAVTLAPAIGLPPELPGMGGEALHARQAWWLATALATGAGCYLVGVVRRPWSVALGVVALAAPHLVGAPLAGEGGAIPPALAARFAARSIALSAVFWAVLGLALAWSWQRFGAEASEPAAV